MNGFSHDESVTPNTRKAGFSNGWTGFPTKLGLDLLYRTPAGEVKTRLHRKSPKSAEFVGALDLIDALGKPEAVRVEASVDVKQNTITLRAFKQVWVLRQPEGKAHFFAYLNAWPTRSEAVDGLAAMLGDDE